jgi:uncharacterized phage infection (PIP) family protein YhgE
MISENENTGTAKDGVSPTFARRFFRIFTRLILVIVLGLLLGAAAYYGIPALYRDWIQPVKLNSQQITSLQQELSALKEQLQTQESESASALADLEGSLSEQREAIAELRAQADSMRSSIDEINTSLEGLPPLSGKVDTIEATQSLLHDQLGQLQRSLEEVDSPVAQLTRQYQLLRVMELITRARFWMIENNLGLAADDVSEAKQILMMVHEEATGQEDLQPIIERLDQVLLELPDKPVIAADDLEIVWKLLIQATEPQPGQIMQPEGESGGME